MVKRKEIKDDLVISKMIGKSVLHIGALGDFKNYKDNIQTWEFNRITKVAKSATAIDINKEYIPIAQKMGFDVVYENAEEFNLGDKFDVVYAGDIIEHLSNIGKFLDRVREHMHNDSIFIVTTPNPHSFSNVVRSFFNKVHPLPEHTCYIDKVNFEELAKRYKFRIKHFAYFTEQSNQYPFRNVIMRIVSNLLPYLSEEQFIMMTKK